MSSHSTDDNSDERRGLPSPASSAQQPLGVSPLLGRLREGVAGFLAVAPGEAEESEAVMHSDLSSSIPLAAVPLAAPGEDEPFAPGSSDGASGEREREGAMASAIQQSSLSEQPSLIEQYGAVGLLAELDALVQTQQFQLAQHRQQVLLSRAEQSQQIANWQDRHNALEEQLQAARDRIAILEERHLTSQAQVLPLEAQRDAAQQQTERLQQELLARRQRQTDLEAQIEQAEEILRDQQAITAAQAQGLVSMQAELSQTQQQLEALETRLSHQAHLRRQLQEEGTRDRQGRSQARDRQLQLEQETTQMTGQLLRLGEALRQAQQQSIQWRRQAQAQGQQLQDIAHWAAQADNVPPALMELLEPLFGQDQDIVQGGVQGIVQGSDMASDIASDMAMADLGELAALGAGVGRDIDPGANEALSASTEVEPVTPNPKRAGRQDNPPRLSVLPRPTKSSALDLPNFPHSGE